MHTLMAKTMELGHRIELCSMDRNCLGISLGLYEQAGHEGPQFRVHSYSQLPGTSTRTDFLRSALIRMGGLDPCPNVPKLLQFDCRSRHRKALRRTFLDLCKLKTGEPLSPKPLSNFDKKANGNLTAHSLGDGTYEIESEDASETGKKRAVALAKGFSKLCEMEWTDENPTRISFTCGLNHNGLIGFLMFRAQNVRSAMKDEGLAATRGVLAAPSQQ